MNRTLVVGSKNLSSWSLRPWLALRHAGIPFDEIVVDFGKPTRGAEIARVLGLWADCRARFGAGGPFLFGHFTIADAMYAPVVTRFVTYGTALPAGGRAYVEAVVALPIIAEWTVAAAQEAA
jgi:glutathione S-transferase